MTSFFVYFINVFTFVECTVICVRSCNNNDTCLCCCHRGSEPLWEFTRFTWWMQTQHQMAANPQTKPNNFVCESASRLLSSTSTIASLLLLSPKADTQRVEGWVDLGTAVKLCSPCPRLYVAAAVVIKHNRPRWDSNVGPHTSVGRAKH